MVKIIKTRLTLKKNVKLKPGIGLFFRHKPYFSKIVFFCKKSFKYNTMKRSRVVYCFNKNFSSYRFPFFASLLLLLACEKQIPITEVNFEEEEFAPFV